MAAARPIIPRPRRPLTPEALGATPTVPAPPPIATDPTVLAPEPVVPALAPDPGAGALIDQQAAIAAEDPAAAAARVAPGMFSRAASAATQLAAPAATPAASQAPRPGSVAGAVSKLAPAAPAKATTSGPGELELATDIASQERMAGREALTAEETVAKALAVQANAELNRYRNDVRETRQRYEEAVAKPLDGNQVSDALGVGGWILALLGGLAGGLSGDPMAMAGLIQHKITENLKRQREDKNSMLHALEAELGDRKAAEEAARAQLYQLSHKAIQAELARTQYDVESEAVIRTLAPRMQLEEMRAAKAAQQHLLNTRLEARAKALGSAEGQLMATGGGAGGAPGIPGGRNAALKAAGVDQKRFDSWAKGEQDDREALAALDDLQNTYEALTPDEDTPGRLESLGGVEIPDFLKSTEAQRLKQASLSVTNKVLKARSGAAVTPQEAERTMSELYGNWSPQSVRQGIAQQRREILERQRLRTQRDPEAAAVWRYLGQSEAGSTPARGRENLAGYR